MNQLRLRDVTLEDAERLWAWRNDETARQNSFSQTPVAWDQHVAWLQRKLGDPRCRMWILECSGRIAGQIRYDATERDAEISYVIAPEFRGRGLSVEMLRLSVPSACEELAVRVLTGVVKEDNVASCRGFERAGFRLVDRVVASGCECRRYEWRCHER